ncbi:MAG: hypothetical protein RIA09_14290 [Hoeflea sp.]|uniref:hypothetical protein n=1 Tax=Hoeflea sp. TaxID=1940281 RepID=UPI0032EE4A77
MNIEGVSHSNIRTVSKAGSIKDSVPPIHAQAIQSYQDLGPIEASEATGTYDLYGEVAPTALGFTAAPPNGYELYMPARPGFFSNNLSIAVTDPSAEPFSTDKTRSEIVEAARKVLDARYAKMADTGEPFRPKSNEATDWYTLFGELDRRALSAIRTDESGFFSDLEQDIAQAIMIQQQSLAMGHYYGPTRLAGAYAEAGEIDPSDHMAVGKAGALWLDRVSHEEKTTLSEWMEQRAAAQYLYENGARDAGVKPEDLSSGFRFVDMLLQAYRELEQLGEGHELNYLPSYQKAWQMFVDQMPSEQSSSMTLFF